VIRSKIICEIHASSIEGNIFCYRVDVMLYKKSKNDLTLVIILPTDKLVTL